MKRQEVTGTNWNRKFHSEEKSLFNLGVVQHRKGCPEILWSFQPWWYSKPDWPWPWTTHSHWLCPEQSGRTRWSPQVPANLTHYLILWNLHISKIKWHYIVIFMCKDEKKLQSKINYAFEVYYVYKIKTCLWMRESSW